MKVVQMALKLSVTVREHRPAAETVASMLAQTPGLRARMILLNAEAGVMSGVCLFEDEISRDDFLAGPVLLRIREAPFHQGLEIKLFDLLPDTGDVAHPPGRSVDTPPQQRRSQ